MENCFYYTHSLSKKPKVTYKNLRAIIGSNPEKEVIINARKRIIKNQSGEGLIIFVIKLYIITNYFVFDIFQR